MIKADDGGRYRFVVHDLTNGGGSGILKIKRSG